jgi:hypothetical protein
MPLLPLSLQAAAKGKGGIAMANLQVFPSATARTTMTISGRVYSCQVGAAPIVVPDFDAFVLLSNGWLRSAADAAGPTAQRPTKAPNGTGIRTGFQYYDSDVGATVIWNGKSWINHSTGAIA